MNKVNIEWNEVKTNILYDRSVMQELDNCIVYRPDSNSIDFAASVANMPGTFEVIGTGIIDNNGEVYVEKYADNPSCYLCKIRGKYCNWWVAAESGENGFDDQVELHFADWR